MHPFPNKINMPFIWWAVAKRLLSRRAAGGKEIK